jgi:CheY-like chemotaxis protein
VVRADRAQRALDLVAAGPRPDLVLSDVVMPDGMNGIELARRLRAAWPHLPIVLTTGYNFVSSDPSVEFPLLPKPYKRADLAAALERALGAGPAAGLTVIKGGAG